ncbi:4-aminobutyrate aminotransferase-like enzyme/Ser/Thr protein kinase RdoA (MazF antagonist) [Streptosporangium becharense]|uniref:4-aminobutyrate aminotransferase-like enzyme/Ser/Thr protein kinase RdoA (MazF antagonist) n=1 Tax=Streptosporangium becharense TaxID=1816182 RepID=A0A7W9IB82_9ACTN|nr:aminotransferase family protein [Streptosporangium becharense]MBB2910835.1 4-aminobutyrate aminotransferase-like enzyme/Ser/Thr protein kinase RdoA (MazF antagonist) [Streptosporangium becharense]MBB5817530.1 4-aminobutyrate aminotransferase-like enzyme/Ser/Thr protein kinase RdoA (MazF antagonist) [Streptosporangium becharense]
MPSPTAFDFFDTAGLPAPRVGPEQARDLARELFGVDGAARELGSQQDVNFLITEADGTRHVLKVSNPAFGRPELLAQNAAAAHVADREPGLPVPRARPGADGETVQSTVVDGRELHVRLLDHLDGRTLSGDGYLAPSVVAALGDLTGRVVRALRDFRHPGTERVLQWDLRHAPRVVELLAEYAGGDADLVRSAARSAAESVGRYAGELPVQAVHGDITDDNVVCRTTPAGRHEPVGVIDFGDLTRSWAVGDLAVTCASLLRHRGATPAAVVPAVRAFHRVSPLSEAEVEVLWPLVVLRGAVLTVSGRHQAAIDAANAYATAALDQEWEIFRQATSVPAEVMTHVLRDALGLPARGAACPPREAALLPALEGGRIATMDLSVTADGLHDGRWTLPGAEREAAAALLRSGADAAVTRHAERRLTRSLRDSATPPATVALAVDVHLAGPAAVHAPWAGTVVSAAGDTVVLRSDGVDLLLGGLLPAAAAGGRVEAGARLGDVLAGVHDDAVPAAGGASRQDGAFGEGAGEAGEGGVPGESGVPAGGPPAPDAFTLRVQLSALAGVRPPAFAQPELAAGWQALCPDPAVLLGPAAASDGTSPDDLLRRRDASFATVQEHYYADPPRIERGWRHHLVDTEGRAYLDMLNNVTILGHGHPRLAEAVERQWRLLNTNSRFHYGAVVELSERLTATLPGHLDTVFLVNSGTEANDLALRIAWAWTGRRDVVAIREAYHGWSDATDAISTSVADNPDALATRPAWVHTLPAPNAYRGTHRGADAARYGPEAAGEIRALTAQGRPPAAFICEPYYGNAGGMPLPDGYLATVYDAVREAGGLCVADEVQVGYGRLGEWFWGFEQQGVLPDIVTVAKAMGNGHPLGAVVTRRDIAERYRSQGYFFSSAGGSPVSSVVGLTVLDAIRDEGLQENARTVGAHLRSRLLELAERYDLIGAVHGTGLYLGVELVRDRRDLTPAVEETAAICERLRELGVIVQPTSDRLCVLKIKPPLCLTRESADFFADMLDRVLAEGW